MREREFTLFFICQILTQNTICYTCLRAFLSAISICTNLFIFSFVYIHSVTHIGLHHRPHIDVVLLSSLFRHPVDISSWKIKTHNQIMRARCFSYLWIKLRQDNIWTQVGKRAQMASQQSPAVVSSSSPRFFLACGCFFRRHSLPSLLASFPLPAFAFFLPHVLCAYLTCNI